MAYSVNGKIYTDHPLMDEIVDCCKTIFKGIVVKNDVLALSYETEESLEESNEFISIVENRVNLDSFPFTYEMLESFCDEDGNPIFTDEEIKNILYNHSTVPVIYRKSLLEHCRKYYMEHYEEKNNYYRSLAGLPPWPETVYNITRERSDKYYNIYISASDFPADYDTSHINFSNPIDNTERIFIHWLSSDDISVLEYNGLLDNLISEYQGFNYSYLRYLGYKSIDIYKARKAIKWEILYMPSVEQLVRQRFEELYNINRSMYLKRTYQDAMSLGSNHYDESLILLLLCQTFNDLVVDVPEWYIRRDIFDIRSVQYFLESFGVEFFPEIPLKYQVAIVKNLNKLIKYKSSAKNNNDIIDIFGLDGTYIYKYFLYKKKKNDSESTDPENYDLEFIKVKQGDAFDKYIEDNIYRYDYDTLTLQDKFWDGVYKEWNHIEDKSFKERLHEAVRDEHIEDADYTVEGTKYMSIDYEIDMSEYKYQVEYFFNMLLDSKVDTDDIKIIVPTVSTSTELKLTDIFIFLYTLSFVFDAKDTIPDKVIRPEDRTTHKLDIETPRVEYYDSLYRDDGDFDDYYKWNNIFGTYVVPVKTDTRQFDFGGVRYDNWAFTDIDYDLSYLYDYYNYSEDPDNHLYDFQYRAGGPDEGYNFNDPIDVDPEEYWKQYFKPRHWEIKTYIENQDPVATAEGYNSYPVWAENYRDWVKRRLPETLTTAYNRVNAFNNALEAQDIDNLLEVVSRRIKFYNFERGYQGYSYKPVYDDEGDIKYYEITYEYSEDVYSYDEYLNYICYPSEPKYDPSKETIEEFNIRHAQWELTLSEDAYNEWRDKLKNQFLLKNPRGPLGIAGFRISKKMSTIGDITDTFDINTICYNDLATRIYSADTREENVLLRYVFSTLFNRTFDYDFYKVGDTTLDYYSDILMHRNYILYNIYKQIATEPNESARRDNIISIMNDIISTLEYYISGDNYKYIFSSFSVASFSNLIRYLYLMISFFKSWKVYFLDPVVTINTDDKLENGNNYGSGMDSIAETKINYWHEDKEFKRDVSSLEPTIYFVDKFNERIKEVLDVYGRFDPDPTDDYNFDGHYPQEELSYRDINGGVVDGSKNIPYRMINGGKAYGKLIDIWDLDGAGPLEMQEYLSVNGGGAYHSDNFVTRNSFDNLYNFNINGGNPGTNQFWTKTVHTRVIDRQITNTALIADLEANTIKETDNGLYIKQEWTSWVDFNELKDVSDSTYSYINYIMEVLYDDLMIITDDELLTERINEVINDKFANMRKVVSYANNIDRYKQEYKEYVDDYVDELKDTYGDFNPYDWAYFI